MEGVTSGQAKPLAVEREFACSRLEEAVLIRAYELTVPVIQRPIGHERSAGDARDSYEAYDSSEPIVKGA